MAKILITGSNGSVGLALMHHLRDMDLIPITSSRYDLRCPELVKMMIDDHLPDVIIHCACRGGTPTLGQFHVDDLIDNISMAENLCQISKRVRLIINIGSGAEYGLHNLISGVSERHLDNHQHLPRDSYGLSKRLVLQKFAAVPNAVTLRLFGFFDPLEANFRLMKRFVNDMRSNTPFVLNQNRAFSWFSGQDLALAIREIIHRRLSWKLWERAMPSNMNMAYDYRNGSTMFLSDMLRRWCRLHSIEPQFSIKTPGMGPSYTCNVSLMQEYFKTRFRGIDASLEDYQ
jgi:nucleoside-diphosphate-sugar epimerase